MIFLDQQNTADLAVLPKPLQAGKATPVPGRTYTLNEAIRYLERTHQPGRSSSLCDPAAFRDHGLTGSAAMAVTEQSFGTP
jgi:hypothetical protein